MRHQELYERPRSHDSTLRAPLTIAIAKFIHAEATVQ